MCKVLSVEGSRWGGDCAHPEEMQPIHGAVPFCHRAMKFEAMPSGPGAPVCIFSALDFRDSKVWSQECFPIFIDLLVVVGFEFRTLLGRRSTT
jgi:hypothetical protein